MGFPSVNGELEPRKPFLTYSKSCLKACIQLPEDSMRPISRILLIIMYDCFLSFSGDCDIVVENNRLVRVLSVANVSISRFGGDAKILMETHQEVIIEQCIFY